MQSLPHHYTVVAMGKPEGGVSISAAGLERIETAPPAAYGGPGNRWSPEDLLVAAVADCFVLTFRSIASASKLVWSALDCEVVGKLERIEGVTKFTEFDIRARLVVSEDMTEEKVHTALEKTEALCLIVKSLSGKTHLHVEISRST